VQAPDKHKVKVRAWNPEGSGPAWLELCDPDGKALTEAFLEQPPQPSHHGFHEGRPAVMPGDVPKRIGRGRDRPEAQQGSLRFQEGKRLGDVGSARGRQTLEPVSGRPVGISRHR